MPAAIFPIEVPGGLIEAYSLGMTVQQCTIPHSAMRAPGGRKAGSAPAFAYSPTMKNSQIVWNREELREFLKHPVRKIPGNRMTYTVPGEDHDIEAIIDYLESLQ